MVLVVTSNALTIFFPSNTWPCLVAAANYRQGTVNRLAFFLTTAPHNRHDWPVPNNFSASQADSFKRTGESTQGPFRALTKSNWHDMKYARSTSNMVQCTKKNTAATCHFLVISLTHFLKVPFYGHIGLRCCRLMFSQPWSSATQSGPLSRTSKP